MNIALRELWPKGLHRLCGDLAQRERMSCNIHN